MAQRKSVSVSLYPELVDTVDDLAHEARMNRSEFIRQLIKEHVDVDQKGAVA